jgi:SAM-dependent methyltransferase
MRDFIDEEGLETLEGLEGAHAFNKWMYESIAPYCQGEILEIGSGIGNITSFFVAGEQKITASDLRPHYLTKLQEKFHEQNIGCVRIDAVLENFEKTYIDHLGKYDTIFALNVVEHIENDHLALQNLSTLLKPGGRLIILVPAYQGLFNSFDHHLGHFRRYTKSSLSNVMTKCGLSVERSFYFNFIGIFGWFTSGKMTRQKTIPKGHIKIYNFLVPIFKVMDKIILRQAGLSVICVARKTKSL